MKIMKEQVRALLVHSAQEPLATLKGVLERQSINTTWVKSCAEVMDKLELDPAPHLVFTDTVLPDGTWERVLALAGNAAQFANVIVVSASADIRLYIETVERGAWDFMTPPFAEVEVAHVVRCAMDNVHKRRAALAQLYARMENTDHARNALWTGWGL
jgi:DNA-binding NtrC family response regulator